MIKYDIKGNQYEVNINRNITLSQKKAIVQAVVNNCVVTDKNGFVKIDVLLENVGLNVSLVEFCTDFNKPEDVTYDDIMGSELIVDIWDKLDDDIAEIQEAIDEEIEYKKLSNQLSSTFVRIVNKFYDKMPDTKDMNELMDRLPKVLKEVGVDGNTVKSIIAEQLLPQKRVKKTNK